MSKKKQQPLLYTCPHCHNVYKYAELEEVGSITYASGIFEED
jgi:hypothetical protein